MGMLAELLFRSDRCHQMSTVLNGGGFWDPAVVDFAAGSVLALLYGCLLVQFFLPGAFAPIFQILVAGRPPKYEKSGQTRTSKSKGASLATPGMLYGCLPPFLKKTRSTAYAMLKTVNL